MHALSITLGIAAFLGQIWFAWEVWQREDWWWALLLFLVPFPLLGLYIWYRADWDSCYLRPATLYFGGYVLLVLLSRVA